MVTKKEKTELGEEGEEEEGANKIENLLERELVVEEGGDEEGGGLKGGW